MPELGQAMKNSDIDCIFKFFKIESSLDTLHLFVYKSILMMKSKAIYTIRFMGLILFMESAIIASGKVNLAMRHSQFFVSCGSEMS